MVPNLKIASCEGRGATLAAIEFGHWLGRLWQRRNPDEKEGSMGALAGATLGLLAFLLALTTSMAGNRFDRR